jgi:amphi-Trp domain-containing protein
MSKKDGAKNHNRPRRFAADDALSATDAAEYLEAIARGLREGAVILGEQNERFVAPIGGDVDFEVAAKHGKRRARIKLALSFRQAKPVKADAAAGSGHEPAPPATIPDEMSF